MSKMRRLEANHNFIAFAIIFLITFIIYWNSLQGEFIWDDKDIILNRTGYLNDWRNLFSVFTEPFFGKAAIYRPLLIVSFIFDYQLWGSHSFGFHYTNVLLHAANAFMMYLLVFFLCRHYYLALFSSLLFITHPVQTEAVAWISGRNDVIVTFFSLLTIHFYIRWHNFTGIKRVLAFIGFLAGYGCILLTKESGVIVFLLIVLIDYFFKIAPEHLRAKRKAYLSIILVSFLYIYLRMTILGKLGVLIAPMGEGFIHRFLKLFTIYAYYFKILFFPIHQTANPFIPFINSIKDPVLISSSCLILLLMLITIACWRRLKEISFIILWISISLIPVSGIFPLTVPALEHRLYLGSVGFSMMVPLLLYRFSYIKTKGIVFQNKGKVVTSLLLLLLMVVYSYRTVARNTVWKDESTFWLKTVQDSPLSVTAHNNLGLVYINKGQYGQAIEKFKEALSINPYAANVHANLGGVYVEQGHYQKGIKAYERALQLKPKKAKLYNNLGEAYGKILKECKLSWKMDSGSKYTNIGLGAVKDVQELYKKSLDNYTRALQLNPYSAKVYNNLGDLYYLEKLYQRALEEYKRAVELNPYYAMAYNNLGLSHFRLKNYNDAQKAFSRALELEPDFAEAYHNLGLIYLDKGLYHKALEEFNRARRLIPGNAGVHFNLALVYLKGFHDTQKSIYHLKESLRLDPHQSRAAMIRGILTQIDSDKFAEE